MRARDDPDRTLATLAPACAQRRSTLAHRCRRFGVPLHAAGDDHVRSRHPERTKACGIGVGLGRHARQRGHHRARERTEIRVALGRPRRQSRICDQQRNSARRTGSNLIGPQLRFHHDRGTGAEMVEEAAHDPRQIPRRIDMQHRVAQTLCDQARRCRRRRGHQHLERRSLVADRIDQRQCRNQLADRDRVHPYRALARRQRIATEALADAQTVITVGAAAPQQAQQRQRQQQREQGGIQGMSQRGPLGSRHRLDCASEWAANRSARAA